MSQIEKAERFASLHVKGEPLVLYNAWDAGSAAAIADAGAQAIATSSWSVAAAQGYSDGENIPLSLLEQIIARITKAVDLPVTIDFEGGYTDDDAKLASHVGRLLDRGVIGINFEDRVVGGWGLYGVERQAQRVAAIRKSAEVRGIPLFINARTDLFLGQANEPAKAIAQAVERAQAYASAGASGFFIPGLTEPELIAQICEQVSLPVNVMIMDGISSTEQLSKLGVARISYGGIPYGEVVKALWLRARGILHRNEMADAICWPWRLAEATVNSGQ